MSIHEIASVVSRAKSGSVRDTRMLKAFGSIENIIDFTKSFVTFVKTFILFDKLASYDKIGERGAHLLNLDERMKVSSMVSTLDAASASLQNLMDSNSEFAQRTVTALMGSQTPEEVSKFTKFLHDKIITMKSYISV